MNQKQTEREREKQIAKLIEASSPEDKQAIEHRGDEGLLWRKELSDMGKILKRSEGGKWQVR